MFGVFMIIYGFIFFLTGLGKICIPNIEMAIVGVIVGLPMMIAGCIRLYKTLNEDEQ